MEQVKTSVIKEKIGINGKFRKMFIDEMNKKGEEWDLMIDAISLKKYKNLVEIENDILTALNCIYDDDWFKEQYRLIDEDLSCDDGSVEVMCI